MLVLRAISISYLYMLPGNAWLLWKAMCKARTLERAWLRIIASVATILLIPFIPTAYLSSILPTNAQQAPEDRRDRKSGEEGKRVSVREEIGGRRIIKKKKTHTTAQRQQDNNKTK